VAPEVDTSGPSSVPIPLLVLGGMSLALLAAGGLGYLSRRRQAVHADDLGDDDTLALSQIAKAAKNSNHNDGRSLLKQTRQQPSARKASWISWRRS